MIRRLRRRHGRTILGLAAVVPLLTVLALLGRPTTPIMPAASPVPSTDDWTALGEDEQVRALIETDGSGEWLHLVREETLLAPDVLVYWAAGTPREGAPLPEDAVLLGALGDAGAHSFYLPLRDTPGALLLFSLGHRAVVASVPVNRVTHLDRPR